MSVGKGLGGVMFKCGVGPLLRTCVEGERQHVERRASGVWGSGVWRQSPECRCVGGV